MSQRPSRHQRRASQSMFVLPENFATSEAPLKEVNCGTQDAPGSGQASNDTSAQTSLHSSVVNLKDQEMKQCGTRKVEMEGIK
ncbi:hypothetical protein FCM35_KLT05318 [Carex littledalei]|uniref:Uncharacterized protein n=1 Tax=Carex littledalei TaxID=544730 RepID=A0A833QZT4_9POAL|nr:hypothetical protein FCM35_KLT05318 [Carex littledalei]